MDIFGGDISKLSAEEQKIVQGIADRLDAVEAKTAADVQAIADKVIAGLRPMVKMAVDGVNNLTITVGVSVQEVTALARRIDGAKLTVTLGPELPDNPTPPVSVTG